MYSQALSNTAEGKTVQAEIDEVACFENPTLIPARLSVESVFGTPVKTGNSLPDFVAVLLSHQCPMVGKAFL